MNRNYKPLSIIILGIIHILSPINMIIFYSCFFQMWPWDFVQVMLQQNAPITNFIFFFLFPLGGVFILLVKRWSFYAYLVIQALGLFLNWKYLNGAILSKNFTLLSYYLLFLGFNVGIVAYFLLSAIKKTYHNPRLRWWESAPRYYVNLKTHISYYHEKGSNALETLELIQKGRGGEHFEDVEGVICDLSSTGAHLRSSSELPLGSLCLLKFHFLNFDFSLKGITVWARKDENMHVYGVQFFSLSWMNRFKLGRFLSFLEDSSFLRRPPKRNYLQDVKNWLSSSDRTDVELMPENHKAEEVDKKAS